jgi:hypothetical protein
VVAVSWGLRLAWAALWRATVVLALLLSLVVTAEAVDGGRAAFGTLVVAARVLSPLALCLGGGGAVLTWRRRGRWATLDLLGVGSWDRLGPLAVAGIVWAMPALFAEPWTPLMRAAPVRAEAHFWPDGEGWATPDLRPWTVPPARLSLPDLWERARSPTPPWLSTRPDRAELLRRGTLALLTAGAAVLGALSARPMDAGRGQPEEVRLVAVTASLLLVEFLALVLIAMAGAASATAF